MCALVGSHLELLGWTPGNVKLLLPPRQSRGISSPFSPAEVRVHPVRTGGTAELCRKHNSISKQTFYPWKGQGFPAGASREGRVDWESTCT